MFLIADDTRWLLASNVNVRNKRKLEASTPSSSIYVKPHVWGGSQLRTRLVALTFEHAHSMQWDFLKIHHSVVVSLYGRKGWGGGRGGGGNTSISAMPDTNV